MCPVAEPRSEAVCPGLASADDGVPPHPVSVWGPSLGPLWGCGAIGLRVVCISIRLFGIAPRVAADGKILPSVKDRAVNFTVCER